MKICNSISWLPFFHLLFFNVCLLFTCFLTSTNNNNYDYYENPHTHTHTRTITTSPHFLYRRTCQPIPPNHTIRIQVITSLFLWRGASQDKKNYEGVLKNSYSDVRLGVFCLNEGRKLCPGGCVRLGWR